MSELLSGKPCLFSNTPEPVERSACIKLALRSVCWSAPPTQDSNRAIGAVKFNSTWYLTLDKPHIRWALWWIQWSSILQFLDFWLVAFSTVKPATVFKMYLHNGSRRQENNPDPESPHICGKANCLLLAWTLQFDQRHLDDHVRARYRVVYLWPMHPGPETKEIRDWRRYELHRETLAKIQRKEKEKKWSLV